MKHRLFLIIALLSLIICITAVGVWSFAGPFDFILHYGNGGDAGPGTTATVGVFESNGSVGVGWSYSCVLFDHSLSVPIWALVIGTAIAPTWWVLRRKFPAKLPMGLCRNCRYDLRAHKPGNKCPECGTMVARKESLA